MGGKCKLGNPSAGCVCSAGHPLPSLGEGGTLALLTHKYRLRSSTLLVPCLWLRLSFLQRTSWCPSAGDKALRGGQAVLTSRRRFPRTPLPWAIPQARQARRCLSLPMVPRRAAALSLLGERVLPSPDPREDLVWPWAPTAPWRGRGVELWGPGAAAAGRDRALGTHRDVLRVLIRTRRGRELPQVPQ